MNSQQSLDTLKDIKKMMERSSRFISLSGWSGVAAGVCALIGAHFANDIISRNKNSENLIKKIDFNQYEGTVNRYEGVSLQNYMGNSLFQIAIATLAASVILAFTFTYLRSKKTKTPIWGATSKKLLISTAIPLVAGGLYLLQLMKFENFGLIAPGCLLFYGLALLSGSRYTIGEIKYLGYIQILLAVISMYNPGYGLYFWAIGFGIMHIVYGLVMWYKYERNTEQ